MALSLGSVVSRLCQVGALLLIATPAAAEKTITCESDGGYKFCRIDTFGKAILVKEISSGVCVGGTNWAYDRQGVWVDKGCKGEFAVNEAWRGGQPGGLTKPNPDPKAKVQKWAVGTFTVHHKDWDTPFTITVAPDGVAHLTTSYWEAWGLYDDGVIRVPTPGAMVYEVKKGSNGGIVVTSLINREHRVLTMAPAAAR
jgi:Protein of unknown function (DUF3011)